MLDNQSHTALYMVWRFRVGARGFGSLCFDPGLMDIGFWGFGALGDLGFRASG